MLDVIHSLTKGFTLVLDPKYKQADFCPIDLSSDNAALDMEMLSNPELHHSYICQYLKEKDASVAFGGYLEERKLYDRADYFQGKDELEKRNVHLGIDLWCEAGTSVVSPLQAAVHSFQVNDNFGDYGPTIILKHESEGFVFHTLYGHLSIASLHGKSIGQVIEAGEIVGTLGEPAVNGDYAPHLHFQVILDLQDKSGDYPGVSSAKDLEYYKSNCPDPNLILKIY